MDWDRLALAVRHRRLSLDLGQAGVAARARVTNVTVSRLENGHSVKVRTLWKLDRALQWQPGSAERILNGGEPTELGPQELSVDEARRLLGLLRDAMAQMPMDDLRRRALLDSTLELEQKLDEATNNGPPNAVDQ